VAIQFARARYISRKAAGNAVRSAAYNGRTRIADERTGRVYDFSHRPAPVHHEVRLPEGAADRFDHEAVLSNGMEGAEKRKDAQVAREFVLALPTDKGIALDDQVEMVRSFVDRHFVSKGLAVQIDIHPPHAGDPESEGANWHAHLLMPTRRLEGDGFSRTKARDLDPQIRTVVGRAQVAEGEAWGELWRDHQNRYFREHGLAITVDPIAPNPGQHLGPVRMRAAQAEIVDRAEELCQENARAAHDPALVLETLTRNNATFTAREVDRFLGKHLEDAGERKQVREQVFAHPNLMPLLDRETEFRTDRFTTRAVRAQEHAVMADAEALTVARGPAIPDAVAEGVKAERTLRPDQEAAFTHAVDGGQLKILTGRAGTGKSYTLAAIHDAHARAGRRVVGLAPTNTVAQDLGAAGFKEASTIHAALFGQKNGRGQAWDQRTVLVVDEAAMLGTAITGELLSAARAAGAKVILAGDDRQLASIERGGLFSEMRKAHGAAEIRAVTRQRAGWQRQAAHDLAGGWVAQALEAFEANGAITWTPDQDSARTALVEAWKRDTEAAPAASRFVFAYTNAEVDALNSELRQVRKTRGELRGQDVEIETKHGPAVFAVGDRVQFTDTLKAAGIYNGHVGTITGIDAAAGRLVARLDASTGSAGREVAWGIDELQGFRHGYAGTIYKGQGKTLDHTYLLHTHHWRRAASYVALTRQRDSAQVFVARKSAPDVGELARQMGRDEVRSASLAWKVREEPFSERVLQQRARADRVGPEWNHRAMTMPDVATLLSPAYAKAAEARDTTQRQTEHTGRAHDYWKRRLAQHRLDGKERWSKMGRVQRFAHRHGLRIDEEMARSERGVGLASRMIEKTGIKLAALRDRLGYEGRVAAAELEKVRPAAERELSRRRKIGREARTERRAQRERAIERERSLSREWGLEWGLSRGTWDR
jgi:Ti-type conjugative transfer relaxase TraA